MKVIVPGVYGVTGLLIGRVYLIEGADGLTLIDTSIARSAPRILKQIESMGRKLSAVKRILITHAHIDHVGGLHELQKRTGAQVIASAIDRPAVEGKKPLPTLPKEKATGLLRWIRPGDQTVQGAPVERVVAEGDVLGEVLGGLQVIATPGHTLGQLSFWQPQQRLLFCGDTLTHFRGLGLPFAGATEDMDEAKRSIRKIASIEPNIVCFGHGEPLQQNTAEQIHAFARNLKLT